MSNEKKIEEMKKILEVIGDNYGIKGDYFYWKLWKRLEEFNK
tara:strand:+ start:272 stop:397 length:126 start_codon:yes stop_codon:yes gene_type:complete